jgi:hypothetical protein
MLRLSRPRTDDGVTAGFSVVADDDEGADGCRLLLLLLLVLVVPVGFFSSPSSSLSSITTGWSMLLLVLLLGVVAEELASIRERRMASLRSGSSASLDICGNWTKSSRLNCVGSVGIEGPEQATLWQQIPWLGLDGLARDEMADKIFWLKGSTRLYVTARKEAVLMLDFSKILGWQTKKNAVNPHFQYACPTKGSFKPPWSVFADRLTSELCDHETLRLDLRYFLSLGKGERIQLGR